MLRRCAEELKSKVNLYWNEITNNEAHGFTRTMYLMNLNVGIVNKTCEEIISLCENLTEIPEYGDPTFIETILKMAPELIENYTRNLKITTFKDYEGVIFSLGKLFSIDPNFNFEHNLNSEFSMLSTQLIYLKKSDPNIYSFDLSKSQISKNLTHSGQIPDYYDSMCLLPNNEIFCLSNSSSKAFTIKFSFTVKMHPPRALTYFAGLAYYKGYVYAFGGSNAFWEKFDLDKSVWLKIAKLPRTTDYCSCAVLGDTMLVVGYHSLKLHGYCPDLNSYFDCMDVTGDIQKSIFTGNNRGYLIEFGGRIFESEINDPFSWQNIGSNSCKKTFLLWYKALYDDAIYFLSYYYDLYRFDLKNKTINVIANLNNN
ncbi:unnamed protein product [Blepharisma stoltei]|uniref:Uncharacterized protein n=1 Tax=Blepharisma stoltei TaxID=1481888 RepID=A0AAU9JHK2_9CILI|nr:unnamed protein product [Blepharisma stoltei]